MEDYDQQQSQEPQPDPQELQPDPQEQQSQEPQADPDDQSGLQTALPDQPIESDPVNEPEDQGKSEDPRATRAQIEADYRKKCQDLETSAQEIKTQVDQQLSAARINARKARDEALVQAGLDGQGNSLPVEREKTEYFGRHRVTAPAE